MRRSRVRIPSAAPMVINEKHALRHSLSADVGPGDPAVAWFHNAKTGRDAAIIKKKGLVHVVVVDEQGLLVTKFCRSKPAHGGVEGTKEYLQRGGYKCKNPSCSLFILLGILGIGGPVFYGISVLLHH